MKAPLLSVIVPTFNRPDHTRACLEALARLDYASDAFEVILVDDGGSCDLESIALPYSERLAIKLVRQPNGGPASARNRGADCASGQFLTFTDDDCEPDPGWLRSLEARLLRLPEQMIGGRTINAVPDDSFSSASQWISDFLYAHYNRDGQGARFFASSNVAMSARLFREIGGFDAGFPLAAGEDREFCHRWLRRGFGLTYAPEAVVRHNHRMRLASYWRQHFRYGRGAFQFRRVAGETGRKVPFEGFKFYWDLLRGGLVVALSQLAVASGYVWQAMSSISHRSGAS